LLGGGGKGGWPKLGWGHLTEDEISEIMELARQTDVRAWAIFALAFNHGCASLKS